MRPHVALQVRDLEASFAFYEKLFHKPPQKKTETYAKFDLEIPQLNFALIQNKDKASRVSHFGIEVDSGEEVKEWKARLQDSGLRGTDELNSHCCYARQDKFWVSDPDGNEWEIFFVYEQLPIPSTLSKSEKGSCCGL